MLNEGIVIDVALKMIQLALRTTSIHIDKHYKTCSYQNIYFDVLNNDSFVQQKKTDFFQKKDFRYILTE